MYLKVLTGGDKKVNFFIFYQKDPHYQKVNTVDHFPVSDSILKLYGFPTFL